MRLAATHAMCGVIAELHIILCIVLGAHVEREVCHKQKLDLEIVHLIARYASHFGIVSVVVILVIKVLRGKHDARDKKSMDIQGVDDELGVGLYDAVDIN